MIPNKAHLRRGILIHRDALPPASVEKIGESLAKRLFAAPLWTNAKLPALYVSTGGEASTRAILAACFAEGRAVALPRVDGGEIRLHLVKSFAELVPGKFGIEEPRADLPEVADTEPDLFLVPGVAFDLRGHRIGYGKGFYDRLLARTRAPVVALAYRFQLVHRIPDESHDRPVHHLLTPDAWLDCTPEA